MKNKGLTYGLVIVVGVIWYQVFIRVKSNITAEDGLPVAAQQLDGKKWLSKRETFPLRVNYRDPFTGSLAGMSNEPEPVAQMPLIPVEPPMPKPKPEPPQWPAIRYYGLVRKTSSSTPRTLLTIDGVFYQLKQGDAALDNVLIKKTYRDSVVINYKKQNRTFYKIDR